MVSTKILTLIIRNVSWAANQHIRMISEESCDAVKKIQKLQLCRHRNKLHFKIYSNNKTVILYFNDISQNYWFTLFDQINAAMVSLNNTVFTMYYLYIYLNNIKSLLNISDVVSVYVSSPGLQQVNGTEKVAFAPSTSAVSSNSGCGRFCFMNHSTTAFLKGALFSGVRSSE